MMIAPDTYPVADPGFDLRGAWTLSRGRGGRKSLKVLNAEVNVMF